MAPPLLRRLAIATGCVAMAVGTVAAETAVAAAPKKAGPAAGAMKRFENERFSFRFDYDAAWIPSIKEEGESVTCSLSAGEVLVSVQRDPNPKHLKTRAELADDHVQTWKNRLGLEFKSLTREETTLGGAPATVIKGTAKLYDAEEPYRLQLYLLEKNGLFYAIKYSGLHEPDRPYWSGFERLVKSFEFR